MRNKLYIGFALAVFVFISSATAQESGSSAWNGEWIAEGTLFRIAVSVEDSIMKVVQIESLGQVWTNDDGEVAGNIARVPVQYAGATGTIEAELIDDTTALLHAASCEPEFMVVCALSKDRQAIFRKVSD